MTGDLSFVDERRLVALDEARAERDDLVPTPRVSVDETAGFDCLTVPVGCPKCGGRWEWVTEDRAPAGVARERRGVIACVGPHCRWRGIPVVSLVDADVPRDLPGPFNPNVGRPRKPGAGT